MQAWRMAMAVFVICLSACTGQAQTSPQADSSFTVATFNIRVFSDSSRTDVELRDIAHLVAGFDILALQETRDILVVERLVRILKTDFGLDYNFSDSLPLGRGSKEIYVFLWRTDRLGPLSPIRVDPDPRDDFSREPAWQAFKSLRPEGMDFVLVNYHAIYGQKISQRRMEAEQLPLLIQRVQSSLAADPLLKGEQDLILLGDFNLSGLDPAFSELQRIGMAMVNRGIGTTIADSPYDNIWVFPAVTTEFRQEWGMVKFDEIDFDGNDQRASAAISDHRPVWAIFNDGPDDD